MSYLNRSTRLQATGYAKSLNFASLQNQTYLSLRDWDANTRW